MSRFIKTFSERLAAARGLHPRVRAVALGEALAVASPEEAEALAVELLDLAVLPTSAPNGQPVRAPRLFPGLRTRNADAADCALMQLARSWRQLPPGCAQAVLAAGDERWSVILPRLSTDPSGGVRLSLAALVGEAGDARLASIAAGMLHDQDGAVGEQAERSLILLALGVVRDELLKAEGCARFVADVPSGGMALTAARGLKGGPDELCRHLADAAMTFGEHRRRGPVIAAMFVCGRERLRGGSQGARAMAAWLNSSQHPSHSVLRSVMRWSKAPVGRLRALEWLGRNGLAIASAERLTRGQSLLEHELVLASAHLLHRPLRVAKLAGVKAIAAKPSKGRDEPGEATFPTQGALAALSISARRGLPRFASAFSIGSRVRAQVLSPLVADPESPVRFAAMRAVPAGTLAEYCLDRDARVARGAFLRSSTAGAGVVSDAVDPKPLQVLGRSPHPEIRVWARQDLERANASPASLHGRLALRRAMQQDRHVFMSRLRSDLSAVNVAGVVDALRQVRSLVLHREFAAELLSLSAGEHPDLRVTATALAMLPVIEGPRSAEVARAQTAHADGRVRANAAESLAKILRRSGRSADVLPNVLIELKQDPHHRVRANAVRATIESGAEGLSEMLADARPMHRLAGVWVAGRVLASNPQRFGDSWPEFAARMGELARYDPDAGVRTRAAACATTLQAHMRTAWQSSGGVA